jgi:hypothetical protein
MRKDTLQLALREEAKINTRKGYLTPAATLRKLAQSPMIFELDAGRVGDWDRFQIRKIGFKAQQDKEVLELTKGKPSREVIIKLGS